MKWADKILICFGLMAFAVSQVGFFFNIKELFTGGLILLGVAVNVLGLMILLGELRMMGGYKA